MSTTSSLPSRTRSIRKPAIDTGLGDGSERRLRNGLSIDTRAAAAAPAPRLRSAVTLTSSSAGGGENASPTRIRPPSSRITGPSNGTESTLRNPSIKPRPTSMYGSTSTTSSMRPPSRDGSMRPPPRPSSRDGSMRPPPRPTSSRIAAGSVNLDGSKAVSRPPMASDNYKISTRTTARASAEPSTNGIARQPSTRIRRAASVTTGSPTSSIGSPRGHTRGTSITNLSSATLLRHPSISQTRAMPGSPTTSDTCSHTTTRRQMPDPRLSRPTFSTLQQHYSPAKSLAPKPTTASILAPGSPSKLPSNVAITAETAKLQAELLQLHLLHRGAAEVDGQFRESARSQLEKGFEEVCRRYEDLVGIEEAQTDRATALVLKQWADNDKGMGFEDRIQVLDEVVAGLWNLSDPGGKYSRVVRRFEKWMNHVQEVHGRREKGDLIDEDSEVVFIQELEDAWRDELRSQSRKVENLKDKLDDLGTVEGKSSLATVVNGCRGLAKGMMLELDTMKKMENKVVKAEQEWIRAQIEDVGEEEGGTAGAVWRRM